MLEIEGVRVVYGRHEAVRGVDIRILPGQTVGLVGESGSGKSSVARAVVGLHPVRDGRILLNGVQIAGPGDRVRHPAGLGLQMVFQDPRSSLSPRMRVRDALCEGARLGRADRSRSGEYVSEIAAKIGLSERQLDSFPHQMSGGQLQRIAIARALVTGADHLLLDEVTASLDVSVQARILNFIRSFQRELGFSMLYISHDLSVVRYLSDYVYVMKEGVIAEHGTNEQVFTSPSTDYTRLLLESVPELDGTRWRSTTTTTRTEAEKKEANS
ncbi:ABC transporter ATP-binding protein [Streptomyces sp. NPDC055607]